MKRQIQFDPQAGKNIKLVEDTDGSQRIESTQNFDTLLKINKQAMTGVMVK